jgi:hypothetical protein
METSDRVDVEGYAVLRAILDEAYDQSARGKGADRHANGRSFEQQPILEIGRMVGPGFAAGQVMKKAQEAMSMAARGEVDAAVRELLGVIVYAASAVALVREGDRRRPEAPADRPFKVGDRLRWKGLWRAPSFTTGKIYEIKTGPHGCGDYGVTDDHQDDGSHGWTPQALRRDFELVEPN